MWADLPWKQAQRQRRQEALMRMWGQRVNAAIHRSQHGLELNHPRKL
jgi:hypothetical protein